VRQLEWDTLGAAGAGKLAKQGAAADGERAVQHWSLLACMHYFAYHLWLIMQQLPVTHHTS
jgi:hypothetical protein